MDEDKLQQETRMRKENITLRSIQMSEEIIAMITKVRTDAHLTQSELTDLTGILQPVLSRIENGLSNPQLHTLVKIFAALGHQIKFAQDSEAGHA